MGFEPANPHKYWVFSDQIGFSKVGRKWANGHKNGQKQQPYTTKASEPGYKSGQKPVFSDKSGQKYPAFQTCNYQK